MSNTPNIYQRLNKCMEQVKYIQKEDKKVNNQYTFVSHDAVTAKTRQAFIDNGVNVKPTIVSHTQNGNRTEMVIDVEFINIDKPEDKINTTSIGYGIDGQDKGPGKAYSYAYKYAILKTLMLETGDDPERELIEHNLFSSRKERNDLYKNIVSEIKDCTNVEELKDVFGN